MARDLPERGRINTVNRSDHEEVLIVRVHPEILRSEGLCDLPKPSGVASSGDQDVWQGRYRSIVDLEHHLHLNGTRIVKFFLHLSPQEKRKRSIQRIDDPRKNCKFSAADIWECKFWPQYMKAYQACLSATSTVATPWYVVPADDKNHTHLIVFADHARHLGGAEPAIPDPQPRAREEAEGDTR